MALQKEIERFLRDSNTLEYELFIKMDLQDIEGLIRLISPIKDVTLEELNSIRRAITSSRKIEEQITRELAFQIYSRVTDDAPTPKLIISKG